jgi:allantoin racemase
MRLIVINGNSPPAMTEGIASAARQVLFPNTALEVITPASGPATIEGYLDGELSALAVCDEIGRRCSDADAFVIACFSDPGLYAARQMIPQPVVGIAEAALLTAVQIGHSFSLLTPQPGLQPVLKRLVRGYHLQERLASIQAVEMRVTEAAQPGEARLSAFEAAGRRAIRDDGAEVLILAGAVMAGMELELARRLGVPVLDAVKCGVVQAQALVMLGLSTSKIGAFSPPLAKDRLGLSEGLRQFFGEQHSGAGTPGD